MHLGLNQPARYRLGDLQVIRIGLAVNQECPIHVATDRPFQSCKRPKNNERCIAGLKSVAGKNCCDAIEFGECIPSCGVNGVPSLAGFVAQVIEGSAGWVHGGSIKTAAARNAGRSLLLNKSLTKSVVNYNPLSSHNLGTCSTSRFAR